MTQDITLTPGAWLTKDGAKAVVEYVNDRNAFGYVDGSPYIWPLNGMVEAGLFHSPNSIVGPWVDPVRPEEVKLWVYWSPRFRRFHVGTARLADDVPVASARVRVGDWADPEDPR